MNEGPQIRDGQPVDSDPQSTPYIDTAAITTALKETAPAATPKNPWVVALLCAAVIGFCLTATSLVAVFAMYQWGSEKSNQVQNLTAQSDCRSGVAAATDVSQANMLNDLARVNLNIARALAKLGQDDPTGVAALVTALTSTADQLEVTIAKYATQAAERAKTADTCAAK